MTRTEKINKLAARLYELDPYEARDYDETPETIALLIKNDPLVIINTLVDLVEHLQFCDEHRI